MKYTVGYIVKLAEKSGITPQSDEAVIKLKIKIAKVAAGLTPTKEDNRAIANGEKLLKESFGDNLKEAAAFLEKIKNKPAVTDLGFSELVETGTAQRLVKLSKENPHAFQKIICAEKPYENVTALDNAMKREGASSKPSTSSTKDDLADARLFRDNSADMTSPAAPEITPVRPGPTLLRPV